MVGMDFDARGWGHFRWEKKPLLEAEADRLMRDEVLVATACVLPIVPHNEREPVIFAF